MGSLGIAGGIRDLSRDAARISTLSAIDISAAVEAFLELVPEKLGDGKTVELGDFGTFRLRVRTTGSDTAEEVTARNITKTSMAFRPGIGWFVQLARSSWLVDVRLLVEVC